MAKNRGHYCRSNDSKKSVKLLPSRVLILGCVLILAFMPMACRNKSERTTQPVGLKSTGCDFDPLTPEEAARQYAKSYKFTSDWFTPNVSVWTRVLGQFKNKPEVRYLEVGLYEGSSAIWMLENILTHPTSHLTGVDIFPEELEARWLANLKLSGQAHRANTIKGFSQEVMRTLPPDSFDIIYIDGSHKGPDVLTDAVLAWPLLKTGGILLFDDYNWRRGREEPPELRPGDAIDAFITMNRDSLAVVHRCYQLAVEKRRNPCEGKEHCSPIGDWIYDWGAKIVLSQTPTVKGRALSPEENETIRTILNSRPYGRTDYEIPTTLLDNANAVNLIKELKLESLVTPAPEVRSLREKLGPKRYSQNDEETFIREFFNDRREGFFVDVGASHYAINSTTYFLERHRGWRGIAVDALAKFAPDYAAYRPNTTFYSAYVSDKSDRIRDFAEVRRNDRLSSGVDPDARREAHDIVKVSTIRLDDLLARQGVKKIDFMSIDIELAEPQALQGFSIKKYRPDLVCIEAHPQVRDFIEQYFTRNGYERIKLYSRLDPLNYYYRPASR